MNAYLKKKIISKIAPIIAATGLQKICTGNYGGIGHILMFHRVVPVSNKKRIHNHLSLEITPAHLEKVINFFIENNYDFLSLDQLYERFTKDIVSDKKFVVFTFDDGYLDNLEVAYPIFKKHNIPFTVYVTTGIPNKTAILWWYILEDMLLHLNEVQFSWQEKEYYYQCKTSDEKEKVFESIQGFIHENFNFSNHLDLYAAVFKDFQSDLTSNSSIFGMTWDQIRTLNSDPLVTIGAHTVNHFNLSKLSEEELKTEILESKIELEKQLGQQIKHFAYPYGKTNHASVREFKCARDLEFHTATTTSVGNIFNENSRTLCSLPRININRVTNVPVLKLQTSGLLPLLINKGKKIVYLPKVIAYVSMVFLLLACSNKPDKVAALELKDSTLQTEEIKKGEASQIADNIALVSVSSKEKLSSATIDGSNDCSTNGGKANEIGLKTWCWSTISFPSYTGSTGVTFSDEELSYTIECDEQSVTKIGDRISFNLKPNTPSLGEKNWCTRDYNMRAEISTRPWPVKQPLKTEEWFGWNYTFAADYKIDQHNEWLFFQVHNGVNGLTPLFELMITRAGLYEAKAGEVFVKNNASNTDRVGTGVTPIAGQTLKLVVHVIYDNAANGLLQVWIDDNIVYDKQIQTVYNAHQYGGNAKWGIYKWPWSTAEGVEKSTKQNITHLQTFMGPLRMITRRPGDVDYGKDSYALVVPR